MTPSLALQYMLPHRMLSRLVYIATRWTWRPWKNFLISTIIKIYKVDMAEALEPDPQAYPTFNAFFTRALKAGARDLGSPPGSLADAPADAGFDANQSVSSPADGTISQIGSIEDGRIFQAKGFDFSVAELLGGDDDAALRYRAGRFATIYLSPRDYHRVHMPLAGTLLETVHVPGRLFSVAPFTVRGVPRLFARNERLVCHFDASDGTRFIVVMVGAMLVSSVETVWSGLEIPPYANVVTRKDWRGKKIVLKRGAEMARFNMGSTVVLLLPPAPASTTVDGIYPKIAKPAVAANAQIKLGAALFSLCCAR